MSDKISIETSKLIVPTRLREVYGDRVGNEICFVLPMIANTDTAVNHFLKILTDLPNETQQLDFLSIVRQEYYKQEAHVVLKELN